MTFKEAIEALDCSDYFCRFSGGRGVVVYCPGDALFYRIAFGDNTNSGVLCEGCDDYMYLTIDAYGANGCFEEDIDGGQMDINTKDYTGYINDYKLVEDCLEFLGCGDIDGCIVIKQF